MLFKKNLIISIFLFFFCLVIYINRISPSVFSGDSGDFLAAIISNGVAHPPGYPLYIQLGRFFDFILNGTTAFNVGFFSAITTSLTVSLVFYLSSKLGNSIIISIVAALTLAFTSSTWLYAETVEAFSLASLFIIIILIASYNLYKKLCKKENFHNECLIISFILGLSLTHHHIILFLVPSLIYLFYPFRKKLIQIKLIFKSIILFFFGLLPYLFSYFSAKNLPFINWDNPVNLENFIRMITRQDYGSFTMIPFVAGQNILLRVFQIWPYFYFLYINWSLIGLFISFIGLIGILKSNNRFYKSIILSLFLFGPFFSFYSGLPFSSSFLLGIYERFIILNNVFIALIFANGLQLIFKILTKYLPIQKKHLQNKFLTISYQMIFLLIPISLFFINKDKNDFSNFTLGDRIGKMIYESADNKGRKILLLSGDLELFNTWYYALEKDSKIDPNLALISLEILDRPGVRESINKFYPWVRIDAKKKVDKNYIYHMLVDNLKKYPIYGTRDIAMDKEFKFIPHKTIFQLIYTKDKPSLEKITSDYNFLKFKYDYSAMLTSPLKNHFFVDNMIKQIGYIYLRYADIFWQTNQYDKAKEAFILSRKYLPEELTININLGQIYIKEKNCKNAEKELLSINENTDIYSKSLQLLIINAEKCYNNKSKAEFYRQKFNKYKKQNFSDLKNF